MKAKPTGLPQASGNVTRQSGLNNGKRSIHFGRNQGSKRCPECGSECLWKDGVRSTNNGQVQRYLCRLCGFRFSESTVQSQVKIDVSSKLLENLNSPTDLSNSLVGSRDFSIKESLNDFSLSGCENVASHGSPQSTIVEKALNKTFSYNRERQVCVSESEAKNLAKVEPRTQDKAAGATATSTLDPATIKGKLVEFALWLSKQGYDEDVVKWRSTMMRRLIELGANLWNPESVKEVFAKQKSWSNSYKMVLAYAYENFLAMEGLFWDRPKYKQDEVFPFIPTEAELDQLIAACGKKVGTFLQGLKDTGADPGELVALKWTDINTDARTVQLRPVKGHRPRVLTVSQQFIDRLQRLPKTSERIFNIHTMIGSFVRQRRRAASKFANPRLLNISFRTFRHWKGTMEYHRTKDILYVQKILGHRQIRNTLKYIDLEANLFKTTSDQFFVRVAGNVEEAYALVEAGFEYVTGEYNDGGKIFRKRK